MKIIEVSKMSQGGKVTVPLEIRKLWKLDKKPGKLVWYSSEEKIYVEVVK